MATEFDETKFVAAVKQWEDALRDSGKDALGKVRNNSVKSADFTSVDAAEAFRRQYDEALVVYEAKVRGIQKDVAEVLKNLKIVQKGYKDRDNKGEQALQRLHDRLVAGDSHANQQTQAASDNYRAHHGETGEESPTGQDSGVEDTDTPSPTDPPTTETPSVGAPPKTEEGEGAYSAANPNAG